MSPLFVIHSTSRIAKKIIFILRKNWTIQCFFFFLEPREAGRGDDKKMLDSKSINNVTDKVPVTQ